MKRLLLLATIACAVLVLSSGSVLAAGGLPSNDSYVRSTATGTAFGTTDPNNLSVAASTSNCGATDITYLQWDLSTVPAGQTISTASLTLTASSVGSTSGATLGIYAVPDNWAEGTLTRSNAPGLPLGTALETKPAPTAAGQAVVFNSAALADYVNTEAHGDTKASFALAFSAGGSAGVSIALFNSKESAGTKPDLTLPSPTAVTLQSFGGANASSMAEAGMGAGVLGLVVVLMFLIRRRFSPTS